MIQRSFNYSSAVPAVSVVCADCGSVVSVTANVTNCRPWRLYLLAVFYRIDPTYVIILVCDDTLSKVQAKLAILMQPRHGAE